MVLTPKQRIELKRGIARQLWNRERWSAEDIEIVLGEFNLPSPFTEGFDDDLSANVVLRDASDEDLVQLYEYLTDVKRPDLSAETADDPPPLRLFASHRDTQKAHVHQVAEGLARFGIGVFVAHDSIEPGEEWDSRILDELGNCHGGVVFLVDDFITSTWCDQEVGWLLGRGVPVLPLKYHTNDPYGPLGRHQALKVPSNMTTIDLALKIAAWFAARPEVAPQIGTSLANALVSAASFDRANQIFAMLQGLNGLTGSQVAAIATAVRDNDQVYKAEHRPNGTRTLTPLARVILQFLVEQPGFKGNETLVSEAAWAHGEGNLPVIKDIPPF